MSQVEKLDHVKRVWTRIRSNSPVYELLLSEITIKSARDGSIEAILTLESVHINSKGTLHGVVSTCLIDWASSLAIASTGRETTGVSTDLHAAFVSTAKLGDVLTIRAVATKVGGSLAYTTVDISEEQSGRVVCHGLHTKYVKQ